MTRAVHVLYTVEQDEDGIWCAHAQLRPGVGANGEGDTAEAAVADLREALGGQADLPGWSGGIVSGAERKQAPVPVGLHPWVALSPQADLQNIRTRASRSPEPQLQPGHRDGSES